MTGASRSGDGDVVRRVLDARILAAVLIGAYVLLPLDRGFPTIPLFGRPLNTAIAASVCVLGILVIQTRGAVLRYLLEPYGVIQSAYAGMLLVGALRAPSPPSAFHWSLLYYSTFVLNFIVLRHATHRCGTQWLSRVVIGVGLVAAAVGVIQAVLGTPLPMYAGWYENYFKAAPPDYSLATSRPGGTMNNPILFSVLMALVIPYTFDLRSGWGRAAVLFAIMFAAGLSGSRTGVFVAATFGGGAFLVYRWRAVRALPAVGLGLVLLLAALTWLTPGGQDSRLSLLARRFSFMVNRTTVAGQPSAAPPPAAAGTVAPGSSPRAASAAPAAGAAGAGSGADATGDPRGGRSRADVSAALGVSMRQQAVIEAAREMAREWGPLTWLIGRGSLTAASIGTRIQPWYNTVDNVYLSVLYERGLLGLALFVGAFFSFVLTTRRVVSATLHWFAPVALAVAGLSFCWDAYSMLNILVVGSMAITMARFEQSGGFAGGWWPTAAERAGIARVAGGPDQRRPSQE